MVRDESGRLTLCDNGSRQTLKQEFTQGKVESLCIEERKDILVNHLLEDRAPKAVIINSLQKKTLVDEELQVLIQINMIDQVARKILNNSQKSLVSYTY